MMSESPNDQKIAADWIKIIESHSSQAIRQKDIYLRLAQWIKAKSASRVLEIGCGQGICSDYTNMGGGSYTGLDPSRLLIERAKELYKDINRQFIIGTAENLPFDDSHFHAIFSVAVWHLLPDLKKASKELARVLKTEGNFLIISANPDAYTQWTKNYEKPSIEGSKFEGKMKLSDGSMATETLFLHSREEILGALKDEELKVHCVNTFRDSGPHPLFIQIEGQK
jgi:ubiquinone/menaquinone biosynthesis C-methylase UbiE